MLMLIRRRSIRQSILMRKSRHRRANGAEKDPISIERRRACQNDRRRDKQHAGNSTRQFG